MVEEKLEHGGDVEGFMGEFGFEPLDYSINVSPLGTPAPVKQAIVDCLERLSEYPDPLNRRLIAAVAQAEGLPEEVVLCGNGSCDLIFRLAHAALPKCGVMPAPTFAEYAHALEHAGCAISYFETSEANGWNLGEAFVQAIDADADMVFVCQPNNPTGNITVRPEMEAILKRCEQMGAYLVVDECFIDFLDDPAAVTVTDLVTQHPKLVVLKAFTKIYAMAGVRLGYLLCSDAALMRKIAQCGQPWGVSTMAQQAGIAALGCTGYVEQVRALIKEERAFLKNGLSKLGIVAVGEANFLFFQLEGAPQFLSAMRAKGILVRDCSNFHGLHAGCYRVAVKNHEDNMRLLSTMEAVLKEGE